MIIFPPGRYHANNLRENIETQENLNWKMRQAKNRKSNDGELRGIFTLLAGTHSFQGDPAAVYDLNLEYELQETPQTQPIHS